MMKYKFLNTIKIILNLFNFTIINSFDLNKSNFNKLKFDQI